MNIDTNILKNYANQIIAARDTARQNDKEYNKNYMRDRVDSIIKQLDVIRAIVPAFNMLKRAKIDFINKFFTEGYHRDIGFSISRDDLIGVCGGGTAKSVFVNFRNEKFIVCDRCCENSLRTYEINIDRLMEKYWDDYYVQMYLNKIACGITEFAERVALDIERQQHKF